MPFFSIGRPKKAVRRREKKKNQVALILIWGNATGRGLAIGRDDGLPGQKKKIPSSPNASQGTLK